MPTPSTTMPLIGLDIGKSATDSINPRIYCERPFKKSSP
jgi:hypothetical protein